MANLPAEYNRPVLEDELRRLNQRIDDMKTLLTFIPQASPVANPQIGMIMYSDGTTNDFSNHTERGLYRYDYVNPDTDGILGWMHFAMNDMEPFRITADGGDFIDYTQSNDFVLLSHELGTNSTYTINLPSPLDQAYRTIKFISDDTIQPNHIVTLDAGAGFTIDGVQTFEIRRNYEAITIFSNGSQWVITQAKNA